jgi:hypothetical protein
LKGSDILSKSMDAIPSAVLPEVTKLHLAATLDVKLQEKGSTLVEPHKKVEKALSSSTI